MSNVEFVNILLFKMEKVNCIVGVMHAHAELFLSLTPPDMTVTFSQNCMILEEFGPREGPLDPPMYWNTGAHKNATPNNEMSNSMTKD